MIVGALPIELPIDPCTGALLRKILRILLPSSPCKLITFKLFSFLVFGGVVGEYDEPVCILIVVVQGYVGAAVAVILSLTKLYCIK